MPCLIIFLLLFFHECGHFFTAWFFKFEVDKIYFYPFGGISKFTTKLNTPLKQEFIVLLMGPLSQILAYIILLKMPCLNNYQHLLKDIHYSLLIFNMLPIYPLDGGRLLNIILNLFLSFKKSFIYSIYISYLIVIIFFIYNLNNLGLNLIFISIFLLYKIYDEKTKFAYYMDKFLLERYLYNFNFQKLKQVNSINDFCKNYRHLIFDGKNYISEKQFLLRKFKK